MSRVIVSVADAVRAELQTAQDAGTFGSLDWTAERSYAEWDLELHAEEGIRVDVVAATASAELDREAGTNSSLVYRVPIDIGVRKKLGPESDAGDASGDPRIFANEVIDELVDLTEQIAEFVAAPDFRLTAYTEAVWQESNIRTFANARHLREWRQYTGIVRVTFRVDRELSV